MGPSPRPISVRVEEARTPRSEGRTFLGGFLIFGVFGISLGFLANDPHFTIGGVLTVVAVAAGASAAMVLCTHAARYWEQVRSTDGERAGANDL